MGRNVYQGHPVVKNMRILIILLIVTLINVSNCRQKRRCPKPPPRPEGCEEVVKIYKRRCLTGYECKDKPAVCAGAPTCPPPPSNDCTTATLYKHINGVKCEWGCKHWCCQDPADLVCPKTSPTNPYCISTTIVKYRINGRRCPVYCSCVPDCRVLTC